jgi:hypothetical protein
VQTEGNPSTSIKEPGFGWMCGYLFLVCFVGLFVLIPLRKVEIAPIIFPFRIIKNLANILENNINHIIKFHMII